jgi:hypothetical protein
MTFVLAGKEVLVGSVGGEMERMVPVVEVSM